MQIVRIKYWLRIKREVMNPLKRARMLILSTDKTNELEVVVSILESVADKLTAIALEIDLSNIKSNKRYAVRYDNSISTEIKSIKIGYEEESKSSNQYIIRYLNHICEKGSEFLELCNFETL